MRRAWAVAVVLVLVAALGVLSQTLLGREPAEPTAVGTRDVRDAGRAAVPVCGYPDLDPVSHDGVAPRARQAVLRTLVPTVATAEGNRPVALQVREGVAYVMEFDGRSVYTITGYDVASGGRRTSVTVPLAWEEGNESFSTEHVEIGPDGSLYLLDTLMGRRDLIRVTPEGDVGWRTELPEGPQTTGSVLDLYGLVQWTDVQEEPVIGVHEGDRFHLVTTGGEYAGLAAGFPGNMVGQLPDGGVVLQDRRESGDRVHHSLVVAEGDGTPRVRLGGWAHEEDGSPAGQEPHWPSATTGVAPGPGGDGLLLARARTGIEWVGADGVRKGLWLDSRVDPDHFLALHSGSDLRLDDGTYYFLTEGRGGVALTSVPEEAMLYLLEAPVRYNALTDTYLAELGIGAGLVTDAPHHYFPHGEEPEVRATFDAAWAGTGYRLRYEVRGDPRVYDPVATETAVVDLPARGGDVRLDLPPARPGVYEVDAALVDAESGRAVSGTCLRYAVGAPGGAGDLSGLAPARGPAGTDPVRGVQLADALALGSYRLRLDFGAIVPDPGAEPDAAALRWDSLPRAAADEADGVDQPFARLAEAAALAEETGTALVLRLASNDDAERAAVANGTWAGWAGAIVAEVHRHVPGVVYWEPWHEPNQGGFTGDDYVERIGGPFARAARAADPDVRIIGGNVRGVEPHWWEAAVAAGGCDTMDVAGVHAKTELNRSREEEGLPGLAEELTGLAGALQACGEIPVWDTESGWWSDGVVNFWAQGSDVARTLVWNSVHGVAEWIYAAEGGFGDTTNTTSLLQTGRHLKPGAAAFAATARLVEGRPAQVVATDVPYIHAVRLGAADRSTGVAEPGDELLALWTDDLSTEVRVMTSTDTEVRVIDHYGAAAGRTISAEGLVLPVTGAPLFVAAPPGAGIEVSAVEPFGPDVLQGASVTASSTLAGATPQVVTSGTANVLAPWRSGSLPDGAMDTAPWVQVTLATPIEIDRVAVGTPGIRCCTTGLRDYTVSVRDETGSWVRVAEQRGQFFDRVALFTFEAVTASAVRVDVPMTVESGIPVLNANYTGAVGGAHPSTMPLTSTSEGIAAISSIAAWSPGR